MKIYGIASLCLLQPYNRSLNPNIVKISNCRVGCAHQKALNLKVEGGHSPPYNKNTGNNQG
ncbi:hypothetical protein D1AOALGA4SA_9728 [Olavius algarvensis Delta 1 endosymbiont]|nr:hypothetical protein D1AOALGA4SA_9728 [Olavius algarvensis Delta 1 endosymbiont]